MRVQKGKKCSRRIVEKRPETNGNERRRSLRRGLSENHLRQMETKSKEENCLRTAHHRLRCQFRRSFVGTRLSSLPFENLRETILHAGRSIRIAGSYDSVVCDKKGRSEETLRMTRGNEGAISEFRLARTWTRNPDEKQIHERVFPRGIGAKRGNDQRPHTSVIDNRRIVS